MSTRQKHTVTEVRELAHAEYPEVIIVMASGREWTFRRTLCHRRGSSLGSKVRTDHLMFCKDFSTRPTFDYPSEYKVAKEKAGHALSTLEEKKRAAGTLKLEPSVR